MLLQDTGRRLSSERVGELSQETGRHALTEDAEALRLASGRHVERPEGHVDEGEQAR